MRAVRQEAEARSGRLYAKLDGRGVGDGGRDLRN